MSYARFGEDGSQVYVYASVNGGIDCCSCTLGDKHYGLSTDEAIAHLMAHKAAGHVVPAYVFTELEADRAENEAYDRTVREG